MSNLAVVYLSRPLLSFCAGWTTQWCRHWHHKMAITIVFAEKCNALSFAMRPPPAQMGWENQKNPFSVRKIRVRNSGAGNGCANFMDTWKKCVLSVGKTMSVKFPFFWGGVGGGGECRFIFMGARIFLREAKPGGGLQLFVGEGPDCAADPFGTVPHRRC